MGNLQLRRVWKAGEEREEPILGALRDVAAIEMVEVYLHLRWLVIFYDIDMGVSLQLRFRHSGSTHFFFAPRIEIINKH